MSAIIPKTAQKVVTAETIQSAAKQSSRCHVVPLRLCRAIEHFLREEDVGHMKKKVARLTGSFSDMKDMNRLLPQSVSRDLVEESYSSLQQSKRWKIKPSNGEAGLAYRDDQSVAYVASRMPSVFAACFRVLREIRRRVPDFSPAKVLDFGSGSGAAFWALREVWPNSLEHLNLIEPSQSMLRAGVALVQDMKDMPLIHGYASILSLTKAAKKSERQHDLVIASYVLGEIPSAKDRIATVRQLWGLTRDMLVLIEPGSPEGSQIITQMRSHILWMEKRKSGKRKAAKDEVTEVPAAVQEGAFIVAPCPHDGTCPLVNTGTYCHFVQRVQRTESQHAYKRSNGKALRGFEDEKFSYVVIRRGKRPQEPWPLDDIKFETLKEMKANRKAKLLEIDYDGEIGSDTDKIVPFEVPPSDDLSAAEDIADDDFESDTNETVPLEVPPSDDLSATKDVACLEPEDEEAHDEDNLGRADLGTGWGRIIFMPKKKGRLVEMNVCRASKRDGSEGSFERLIITQGQNPVLHRQARKSIWGDLWPF